MLIEEKLKIYFNNLEKVYGEEVAVETATESISIVDSLRKYSSLFENSNDKEVLGELAKKAIIFSNNSFITKMVKENEIEDLMINISTDILLKKDLIKNYIRALHITPIITEENKLLLDKIDNYVISDSELEKRLSLKLNKKNEIQ